MTAAHCAITCLCVYKCSHNTHKHSACHLGAAVQVSRSQTSTDKAGGKAIEEATVAEPGQGQRGLFFFTFNPPCWKKDQSLLAPSPLPSGSICFSSPCLPNSGGFVHQPSSSPLFFSLLCLLFSKAWVDFITVACCSHWSSLSFLNSRFLCWYGCEQVKYSAVIVQNVKKKKPHMYTQY